MDKIYKIGKKMNACSEDSRGRVVRALMHGTEGTEGTGFEPRSVIDLFFSSRKIQVFWGANGTVCDNTVRTKFPVPVPVLWTQPIIILGHFTFDL